MSNWQTRRAAALGNTPEAHTQAQAEWERAHALLERVKREDPVPRTYGRAGKPIDFDGQVRTIAGWARHLGMLRATLHKRIKRWGVERALRTPALRYEP